MPSTLVTRSLVLACLASVRLDAQTIDLGSAVIVDLTHPYNAKTVYWPTETTAFKLETRAYGRTEAGFFYAAFAFCMPEHGGTHLDAPLHFAEGRDSTDRVPLRRLLAQAIVIDVSAASSRERDYRVTAEDVARFEREHGRIAAGTIVLVRTGWSRFWPDRKAYLGDDTPGDASRLHFPGFGAEAARLLVEDREAAVLGIDTASLDHGPSRDFQVHRLAGARNVPGLENLTGLDRLPPRGAVVVALPMKIEGGSGGPVRVVALLPPAPRAAAR
jgi:kynurenine formamidase